MKDIAIFGAGGFGREVQMLIEDINKEKKIWNIIGFFDDGYKKGEIINNIPTLGGIGELNAWDSKLSLAVAIGNPETKQKIIQNINNAMIDFPTLIHPSAIIGNNEYLKIGRGCIICAGCIITTNIEIKDFVILNLACTVGHDTIIGKHSSFMPTCNISGEVNIGECVYCGTGAKIINQMNVGANSVIGAGAVVITDVPNNAVIAGVPAVVKKIKGGGNTI